MRINLPGVKREGAPFQFTFAGQAVTAYPGESVAAALMAAGIRGLRQTREGDWRGVYCGMGVCGECAVRIDGDARRACMTPAMPGLQIESAPARATVPKPLEIAAADTPGETLHLDVLVVGAGPAGLAAAEQAAHAGLDVLVVDERSKAGGQYYKQPGNGFTVDRLRADRQFIEGADLAARAVSAGARFLFDAAVWAAAADGALHVVQGDRSFTVRARRLIVATGAYERPHMIPGWTLPGVMTTGAAQTLLRAYQTAPGRRVLVAGNGPLNLQVARELSAAGVEVVALVEQAPAPGLRDIGRIATMLQAAPGLVAQGVSHTLRLLGRVPVYHGHVVLRAEGDGVVQRGVIARIDGEGAPVEGSERQFDVDAICLGYGFLPQAEIARAMGCDYDTDPRWRTPTLKRDDDGRTSAGTLFVVGDAGGLGGARVAMAQGVLAGLSAAADLGGAVDRSGAAAARTVLRRHRRFQTALWQLYAAPPLAVRLAEAETPVCRCESVDRAALDALTGEARTIGELKRATRAGMGRCQGRYCGAQLAAMIRAAHPGTDAEGHFAPRAPFKPVSVATVAGAANA